jgi:hypothetical protein
MPWQNVIFWVVFVGAYLTVSFRLSWPVLVLHEVNPSELVQELYDWEESGL